MKEMPTEKELIDAFKSIERTPLVPNAIYCSVCGQGVNFRTKEGSLCEHLRQDFDLPELPKEKTV